MMYSNDCVIAILHKGNVLRENNGEIHLPFGSNYKIRAKNNGLRRVKVEVKVDGSYIHPENQSFVINPNTYMDLERMLVDGNLNSGPKLKFVELSDSRVQDPTNRENGLVEVSFYREKFNPISPLIIENLNNDYIKSPYKFDGSGGYRGNDTIWSSGDTPVYSDEASINCNMVDGRLSSRRMSMSKSSTGATVGGSKSKQGFSLTDDFDTELIPTVLTLKMFGLNTPTYVKDTKNKFCDSCGRKNRFKAKFCSQCGRKI